MLNYEICILDLEEVFAYADSEHITLLFGTFLMSIDIV